ncbi:MAG: prolyl oligopeptidase family serine peptidase, partial [Verrucomicrobiota bacterium]
MNRFATYFFILAVAAAPVFAQKRNITEKDLWDFVWIGDAQVSPDGSRVAFVRVTVNEKKEGYKTAIWSVPTAGGEAPHQLTKGDHDNSPRWSPDGKFLVFVRATEKDGKSEPPQLSMLPMAGGDSFSFTDLPKGASNPVWSPDGKQIAFTSGTNAEDLTKQEKKKNKEEELKKAVSESAPANSSETSKKPAEKSSAAKQDANQAVKKVESESEHESDVRVITRAVYREDDDGYADPKHPSHIWVIQAPHSAEERLKPKQLTSGRFDEGNIVWAKDAIYFLSQHVDEPYYELPKSELYSIAPSGGTPAKLNTIDMDVGGLSISPEGKQFAFIASITQPVNSYTQPDLWVVDVTPNAKPKNLTAGFDFDLGSGPFGDNGAPRAGGRNVPIWTPDGHNIIEIYGKEGKAALGSFDAASGAVTDIVNGNQAVLRFRASGDGSKIIYATSTATRINDLFVLDRTNANAQPVQLTKVNDELFSKLNLTEPEEISYKSFDGKTIQAWVQKPPDFSAGKKYPLILNIHGGPHGAYGYIFEHEFQWMAAKGYVVLYANPRGSTTYGQDFGNVIQYHYPGDDYKDLMAGVDEVIKRGYIDDKKLGVTGGSGGGLLTNWVVGHTDRFAAAVSQRDIANWAHWWYTADFTLFQANWFKAPPFEDEEDFKARSPITY